PRLHGRARQRPAGQRPGHGLPGRDRGGRGRGDPADDLDEDGAMSGDLDNRLSGPIDGALHLLDRQLLDSEARLLGKVDDVELSEVAGRLTITGLLAGPAALLDRFGGRLGRVLSERWGQLRVSEPDRTPPWRIRVGQVERLDSAVHLAVRRDGVLRRDRERLRLGRLTGMHVEGAD